MTYRLKQVDADGTTSFSVEVTVDRGPADELQLLGTYPNPARPDATVRFAVSEAADGQDVTLRLCDVMGDRCTGSLPPPRTAGTSRR